MSIRGIRGAIQIDADEPTVMREGVVELMSTIMTSNSLAVEDLISVLFTCTPDLVSDFPAASARAMGLGNVPLLCAVEMAVPESLPRTIRVLVHASTNLSQQEVSHIYLRGATVLRKDLAQ